MCVCVCVCVSVCPYSSTRESRARSSERASKRERNAHSTARHLSVPVHCLRKCTLILAIKEQIVRGAMPALTAAVQWSRLQGGSRLAKTLSPPSVFSFLGLYRLPPPPPPPPPPPSQKKKVLLCPSLRTQGAGLEKALTHRRRWGRETAAKT